MWQNTVPVARKTMTFCFHVHVHCHKTVHVRTVDVSGIMSLACLDSRFESVEGPLMSEF